MPGPVAYDLDDGVGRVTLDDGKVNALSPVMLAAIGQALDRAEADGAKLVELRGRAGVFSGGFDLAVLARRDDESAAMIRGGFELALRVFDLPVPVLAVCPGHAVAMGVFLMLCADYRLGTAGPFRITCNEVKLGMTMPYTALEIIRQRLTPAHFYRSVVLADVFTPELAVEAGLLDRVVPEEELDPVAAGLTAELRALHAGAYGATKRRVRGDASKAIRDAIAADMQALESERRRIEADDFSSNLTS